MNINNLKNYRLLLLIFFLSCNNSTTKEAKDNTQENFQKGTYAYDANFLKNHTKNVLELQDENGGARLLLSADYQGRVITSSAAGDSGNSFGWINYELIASNEKKKQFNPVGGEERFWLGPEGGQYSIYFKQNDSFNITHWQVPPVIDTETYETVEHDKTHASFSKNATLTNYSGTPFSIAITRIIQLLDKNAIEEKLQTTIPANVQYVAYETDNQIKNTGSNDWKKEKGLLSIWLLGMMTPTEETKVIIPFLYRKDARSYITDDYFGKIPSDRLLIKDSILFLRCDGKARGKIGISPVIAKPIAGSFDFKKNVLTILIPEVDRNGLYVNSKWEIQKQPYKGDVINSYNDGPLEDGTQLGPFYEIESSSSAKELKQGETQQYKQTTCHFEGDYQALSALAKQLLNVDLDEVRNW